MATTTFPCPACFTPQAVHHHQAGQEVAPRLCAACEEEAGQLALSEAAYVKQKHALRAAQEAAQH